MMKQDRIYGVLTGDLVRSKALERDRAQVLSVLKKAFKAAASFREAPGQDNLFSRIFRGDSFQAVVPDPVHTLRVALFLRARLLMIKLPLGQPDARIGLGIGKIESLNKARVEESDGEAFRHSGRALDGLKGYRRLAIVSRWPRWDRLFEPLGSALDAIMLRWTPEQAEAMCFMLQGWTQQDIARRLGVRQPAVQQRLVKAGHFAVSDCLSFFESGVEEYKSGAL